MKSKNGYENELAEIEQLVHSEDPDVFEPDLFDEDSQSKISQVDS